VRRKVRTQRRYGMKQESPLIFYPRRPVEQVVTGVRWLSLFRRYKRIRRKVEADPNPQAYSDIALMTVKLNDDFEPTLSLHSRADGSRHGTASVIEHSETLFVASKGGDAVLAMPIEELFEQ